MEDPTEGQYALGTGRDELERLAAQHRLWQAEAVSAWERAGVAPGATVLDCGCGPGFATLDLARLVGPRGRVLAWDLSEEFIRHLKEQSGALGLRNVTAEVVDLDAMSRPPPSIDFVFARWVFSFLPDPGAVVRSILAGLKPGGKIVVQDYYHYDAITACPGNRQIERAFRAAGEAWRTSGGDPDVGMRIPGLLEANGTEVMEMRSHVKLATPGTEWWRWPESYLRNYLPKVIAQGLLTEAEAADYRREWRRLGETPGAFFSGPGVIDILGVKRDQGREAPFDGDARQP